MNQILLGIDPGLAATGYGILEIRNGTLIHRDHGVIKTSPSQATGQRLNLLYNSIRELVEHYSPVAAGLEQLFFAKNVTSALPVAEARGVVLLCFEQISIPAMDFTPLQIKQSVVGVGRATKEQVQEMVKFLLGLNEIPRPDHAADALAVAICLYHRRQWDDLSS
jgi:crossover junction endodeoxyribonuclease RuvC